ncbi:MAG: minor capsid protein [Proteobacteria bacterium]|nr:minor capsid protein [Pseudomonadota bacterium]
MSQADPPRLPDGFDVPFADAIAWARERRAMLPAEFYGARAQAVRARGFAISGLAALDQVQAAADNLAEATASGQTLREWQRGIRESAPDVFSLGRARRELIFRNAVQTHYGIGRTIQQRENAAARPYLMWDAINDSRTRPTHRAMDGHIAPIDDHVWERWSPPAGYNCRCTRISLTEAQARARGYPKAAPAVEPDAGWEGDPTEGNEDLVSVIRSRQASCLTTFAAKKVKERRVWCDEPELARRVETLALAVQNGQMTEDLMRRSLGSELFDRVAGDVLSRALPAAVSAAGLSLVEKVAIHAWTLDTSDGPWFARINDMMRMADVTPQEYEAVFPVAHALHAGLLKLPPFVGAVFRGVKERPIGAEDFEQFVRNHETLPEVYHPGFVGASVIEYGALRGRARMIIESRTGRDISSLSSKPEQREVLFAPPLKVKPMTVERLKGWVRIWASEI